jgi:hypothetical protein
MPRLAAAPNACAIPVPSQQLAKSLFFEILFFSRSHEKSIAETGSLPIG